MENFLDNKINSFVSYISEEIIPNYPKGFTIDPKTKSFPLFHPDEFIVSLEGHERRFQTPIKNNEVETWIEDKYRFLEGRYLGGWLDEVSNEFVLDISVAVTGLRNALLNAKLNNQDAIYWFYNNEVIYVNDEEQKVA